jgi:tetratricopeptide (TPR) repeat protein
LNNLAWLYQQRGNLAKARGFAERAVALAPSYRIAEDTLGWILLAQGDIDQALTHLKAASDALPQNAEIQFHFAVALSRAGKKTDARRVLETILSSGNILSLEDKNDAEKLLQELKNG